jgi:PDZ domain/Trypsin-like peptidase domain
VFGSEISITQGVVSRIQLQRYSYSDVNLLSVQTDSAVNPGNSGGPVLDSNNLVVGIAFQTLSNKDTDHVGEFIPCCVFERFLKSDACNGEVIQVPGISFYWQTLESKSMRAALGLDALQEPNNSGVYVISVTSFGSVADVLREGDVIVSVDGVSVGNQGTIPFRAFRVGFSHLFTSRAVGDEINVGIVRDGARMDIQWTLQSVESSRLVPVHDKMKALGSDPEYLIIAGLVFIGLNAHSIQSEWNDDCSYDSLALMKYYDLFGTKQKNDQECVLLSQVLDADVNSGYEGIQGEIVDSFNGVPLNSVSHLAELYRNCTDKYMHIKLVNKTYLILDREMAEQSEAEILLQHNIPAPYRIGVAGADMKDEIVLSSISANSSSPNLSSNDISGKIDVTDNEEVGATQP